MLQSSTVDRTFRIEKKDFGNRALEHGKGGAWVARFVGQSNSHEVNGNGKVKVGKKNARSAGVEM